MTLWRVIIVFINLYKCHGFEKFRCLFEKFRCRPRPLNQIIRFQEAIEKLGLIELEFSGYAFTWTNNRVHPHTIKARLDQAFATASWLDMFERAGVRHLSCNRLDHLPLLLGWSSREGVEKRAGESSGTFSLVLEDLQGRCFEDGMGILGQQFSKDDVKVAVLGMTGMKTLGPDGMPLFYQKYWDVVGGDVTAMVLETLNQGRVFRKFGYSHISLLPKVQSPEWIAKFRPISLCNVVSKVISKCLTNRLKQILPSLIS
ncbi:hypothetical protein LIER_36751 [Lithospermum erythrorhizon]|uniref:Reverse transcriptase n=1 Tax=Lithospermum erythrorhizon TaxID=34254 RepID=A0AAV3PC66_LITER